MDTAKGKHSKLVLPQLPLSVAGAKADEINVRPMHFPTFTAERNSIHSGCNEWNVGNIYLNMKCMLAIVPKTDSESAPRAPSESNLVIGPGMCSALNV